ncbi:hypothetical protein [Nonomuraea sp. NPDC049141]|uniref:hypothetical protein n=1 Tax=Nonomuraea sp. NPDC049141 TaxID=3155500 RepID=UPI0033F2098C
MHKLVWMTDEEREQTIDDFWNDVGEDLDVPESVVDRLRTMRPVLPADPTAAQLEAWIDLADLVSNPVFRDAVRTYLQDIWSTPETRVLVTEPFQDFMHASGARLVEGTPRRVPRRRISLGPAGRHTLHGSGHRAVRHTAHPRSPKVKALSCENAR